MNPVLLKSGGIRASDGAHLCSVIVRGKHYSRVDYGNLGENDTVDRLRSLVLEAHASLARLTNSECIVAEGAGSCAEMNLMDRDFVNIPLVRRLRCPWLLVADIDKGGVFAQIYGTKECLTADDWDLCCGIVVNRLRGDTKFFEPGPRMIEERVGKPVYVVPWIYGLHLPEEDGVGIEARLKRDHEPPPSSCGTAYRGSEANNNNKPLIVVVAYPHVSIDSDLLPLERDSSITLQWRRSVLPPAPFPQTHAVVLPGSRLTRCDLDWLTRRTGWGEFIREHVRRGGAVLGLCGGYQMLGTSVQDGNGVEGERGTSQGLGLLPVMTTIEATDRKIVTPRTAVLDGVETVEGFELHCGRTTMIVNSPDDAKCREVEQLLHIPDTSQCDGARSGKVSGCYLHGILESDYARRTLLHLPQHRTLKSGGKVGAEDKKSDSLDQLADQLESCALKADTVIGMFSYNLLGRTDNGST